VELELELELEAVARVVVLLGKSTDKSEMIVEREVSATSVLSDESQVVTRQTTRLELAATKAAPEGAEDAFWR